MTGPTRRDFLTAGAMAAAGATLGGRRLSAAALRRPTTADAQLPDMLDAAALRTLATRAIDAARSAGATYADVRVSDRQVYATNFSAQAVFSDLNASQAYGVRALVDGVWAFVYGVTPTVDGIAEAARRAVRDARSYRTVSAARVELAPAPVVQGEWATPFEIDPFTVPLPQQVDLLGACLQAGARLTGLTGYYIFEWSRETRVFASTDGSLITQRFRRARPSAMLASTNYYLGADTFFVPGFNASSGGYELALQTDLQATVKASASVVQQLVRLPQKQLDVGRYEAVFDGASCGGLFGDTFGPAFEAGRVFGDDMNADGDSFLTPPEQVLGVPAWSRQLDVRADQELPNFTAAKWDDEGVATRAFPLVEKGAVVDYCMTRDSAPALAAWYRKRGVPEGSRGSAIAWSATRPPIGGIGHVTLAPGTARASLADLYRGVKQGILVTNLSRSSADAGLRAATITRAAMFEIKNGQLVSRVRGNVVQCGTEQLWKRLSTLGDASTMGTFTRNTMHGLPWWAITQNITAPALLVPEISVFNLPAKSRS